MGSGRIPEDTSGRSENDVLSLRDVQGQDSPNVKDIKDYANISRLHRGRIGKVQQGSNAQNIPNAQRGTGQIH
ncbi:hypothetical protein J6S88_02795 [bacterium]|nr:hypothetical protein [bacterium]